jgi:hypothetical protein
LSAHPKKPPTKHTTNHHTHTRPATMPIPPANDTLFDRANNAIGELRTLIANAQVGGGSSPTSKSWVWATITKEILYDTTLEFNGETIEFLDASETSLDGVNGAVLKLILPEVAHFSRTGYWWNHPAGVPYDGAIYQSTKLENSMMPPDYDAGTPAEEHYIGLEENSDMQNGGIHLDQNSSYYYTNHMYFTIFTDNTRWTFNLAKDSQKDFFTMSVTAEACENTLAKSLYS